LRENLERELDTFPHALKVMICTAND